MTILCRGSLNIYNRISRAIGANLGIGRFLEINPAERMANSQPEEAM
jgi:hypothetical protein